MPDPLDLDAIEAQASLLDRIFPISDVAQLASRVPALVAEVRALRATNSRLNRRAQQAEAAAQVTIEDCKRQGVSLGRLLSAGGYAMRERERDEARADLAAERQAMQRVIALHQPKFWNRYYRPTDDRTEASSARCDECRETVPLDGCKTFRAALSPAGSET